MEQPGTFTADAGSRNAGASVRLWVLPKEGRIERIRFEAYGCPHFIAAADAVAEWCEGRKFDDLQRWSWQPIQESLKVPAAKRGRLLILENALKKAYERHISTLDAAG